MIGSWKIRVVLAAYLAIWSPAVCCCAIKSALRTMTGFQPTAYVSRESNPGSCCGPAADHRESSKPAKAPPREAGCQCHETTADRLDTGGKTMPAQALGLLGVLDTSGVAEPRAVIETSGGSPWQRWHPPPPNSLLGQHCLLII